MSWENSDKYKVHKGQLLRSHAISAKLGMSDPAIETYELVLLEMKCCADLEVARAVAGLVYRWRKERDTYFMDKAMLLCHLYKVTPPPTLLSENAGALMRRLNVGHGALKASAAKIERDSARWQAFVLMMNLIYHGEPLHRAASKTSRWMAEGLKVKPIKASSLDKYYVKEVRNTGVEERHFENWRKWKDSETREQWRIITAALPEADEELKGVRRE